MDERTYKLVATRDLSGAPRDVRLGAARLLAPLENYAPGNEPADCDYSAETLNILHEESERLEAASKPRR